MANQYILKTGLKAPSIEVGDYSLPTSLGTDGQILSVSSGSLIFATPVPPVTDLDSLSDVILTSPASGEMLQYNGTEWVNVPTPSTGIANLVEDTTPQLGGNLDVNGHNISAGELADLTLAIDDGKALIIGSLKVSAPQTVAAFEVTAGVEYSFTFSYPLTFASTYIDYVFKSDDGWKMGTLFILNNGTTTSITDMGTELDTPSIDFTATINGSNIDVVGTNLAATAPQDLRISMRQMA